MAYNPGKDRNMMAALKRTMDAGWFGADVSQRSQVPNVLSGEYLISVNAAKTGTVGLVGSDASDQVTYPLQSGITISSAQLLALNTSPVTLIPAPGAGFATFVESMVFEMNRTATAYTAAGVTGAGLIYAASTALITQALPTSIFTTAGAGQSITAVAGGHVGTNGITITANAAVQLYSAGANLAAGTGTAKVYLTYSIITL